jgi:metal-responsive CopG/Arc/MetJ family transcriptional regulator
MTKFFDKKILFALPQTLLDELDALANNERRPRSDMLREIIRAYLEAYELNGHKAVRNNPMCGIIGRPSVQPNNGTLPVA